MPSLVSVQILAGVICFFCTAYLILSIFYPISFQQIIGEFRLQPQLLYSDNTKSTNVNKSNIDIQQYLPIRPKNLSSYSYICDYIKPNDTHNQTSSFSFETHRVNALHRKYLISLLHE